MKRNRNGILRIIIFTLSVVLLCVGSFFFGGYYTIERSKNNTSDEANDLYDTAGSSKAENNSEADKTDSITITPQPTNTVTDLTGAEKDKIIYSNTQYGFDFTLPSDWKGYTVRSEVWKGMSIEGENQGETVEFGIELMIRHPEWTEDNPRQDIPIMVFTLDQWDKVKNDQISVSAAPIIPTELGRNSNYVFALPARYNFAFLTGYEEVEDIISGNPLVPNEDFD